MSENNGNPTTKDGRVMEVPTGAIQIIVTWDQMTGALNVNGAINNYVIACGMLEAAKDVIRQYIQQQNSKAVVIAKPNLNLRM